VKWAGGKTRLLPELVARMPRTFRRYYEPFCGGAALYLHVEPAHAVLADLNADLIETYRTIATQCDAVIEALCQHAAAHSAEHYYATRDRWNARQDHSATWRAATFFYLNKTCFNGLWRVNRSGAFNAPLGSYDDPRIVNEANLRAAATAFGRATLACGSFEGTACHAGAEDFVYFDPPYVPLTETSRFTAYTAGGFGDQDQRALADLAHRLVSRGCYVMLSASDTPRVRELYGDFQIDRVACGRSIGANPATRGRVSELVITAGYELTAAADQLAGFDSLMTDEIHRALSEVAS
jgi:DNA adenine methylase